MTDRELKRYIDNFLGLIGLRPFLKALRILKVIEINDGHFLSSLKSLAVTRNNQPIPWFTYPAIEYLNLLDLSKKTVFEYGGGNSTFYWARRARNVTTVENEKKWYEYLVKNKTDNMKLDLAKSRKEYIEKINSYKNGFDIIVLDGPDRKDCVKHVLKKLKKGGFIILDNSERELVAMSLLTKSKLIRVDMAGFGPINPYKWQTSFFIDRNYSNKNFSQRKRSS